MIVEGIILVAFAAGVGWGIGINMRPVVKRLSVPSPIPPCADCQLQRYTIARNRQLAETLEAHGIRVSFPVLPGETLAVPRGPVESAPDVPVPGPLLPVLPAESDMAPQVTPGSVPMGPGT